MTIHNARANGASFFLDKDGFQLCRHQTKCHNLEELQSDVQLAEIYCREIEAFLRELTGGTLAVVRRDSVQVRCSINVNPAISMTTPVRFAHSDNTDLSAQDGIQSIMDQMADRKVPFNPDQYSRYAIYNIWRCFSPAPQDIPLAVCDPHSIELSDEFVATSVKRGSNNEDIFHDTTVYRYNLKHRWLYFPNMNSEEVVIFKQHDTKGTLQRTPHTAFDDPTCPTGLPTRKSVEVRAAVFF